jgi:hypothetical protein
VDEHLVDGVAVPRLPLVDHGHVGAEEHRAFRRLGGARAGERPVRRTAEGRVLDPRWTGEIEPHRRERRRRRTLLASPLRRVAGPERAGAQKNVPGPLPVEERGELALSAVARLPRRGLGQLRRHVLQHEREIDVGGELLLVEGAEALLVVSRRTKEAEIVTDVAAKARAAAETEDDRALHHVVHGLEELDASGGRAIRAHQAPSRHRDALAIDGVRPEQPVEAELDGRVGSGALGGRPDHLHGERRPLAARVHLRIAAIAGSEPGDRDGKEGETGKLSE